MVLRLSILSFLLLLMLPNCFAQQHRLDSLEKILAKQPKGGADHLATLTALAKTCATIDPWRAFDLSKQAVALARKLGDEHALAKAWLAQRWCLFCLGEYAKGDSLTALVRPVADRTKAPCLYGENSSWFSFAEDWTDSTEYESMRLRFDSSLVAIRMCGDRSLRAERLFWNGYNLVLNKDARLIEEALGIYRSLGDKSGVAMCLNGLNQYAPYVNDPIGAQQRVEEALANFEEDGNRVGVLWMHGQLTWMLPEKADFVGGVRHGQMAVELAEALGLEESVGVGEVGLAEICIYMGDFERANDLARRSLKHLKSIDYRLSATNDVGWTYLLLGELDSARITFEQAIGMNPYRGDELRYAESRGYLAMVLVEQGDFAKALELFNAALSVHRKYPANYRQDALFSLGLGRLFAEASPSDLHKLGVSPSKARAEAFVHLEHALELGKTNHMLKEQQDALHALAQLYGREGRSDKAFEYQQLYDVMRDSVLSADKAKAVARLESAQEEKRRNEARQAEQAHKDAEAAERLRKQKLLRNWLIGGAAFLALFGGVVLFQRNRIRKERDRSENLLLNILPSEIAAELKAKGRADARDFDMVSILFTDFKGFTEASAKLTAQELVTEINTCFEAFDAIVGKYGIEKIKTIGDSYMAAGGLPVPNADSVKNTVLAALEMQAFIAKRKAEMDTLGKPAFRMRVGIHTGPVVAGIVGVKKFQYDIWGDTVNTASRMESSGEVGQVNISEATYELVKNATGLTFTPRGKVQAKGKGEIEMYFVQRA